MYTILPPDQKHFRILDALRGLAALAVVFRHFSGMLFWKLHSNLFHSLFFYGKYGVQVFFVISGFVIPYSLYKSGYKPGDFWNMLARRFVRLAPAYYIASLLLIGFYFFCQYFYLQTDQAFQHLNWPGINVRSILGNLTFTAAYLHSDYFNPVAWTLALEFQFYVGAGLILPFLLAGNWKRISILIMTALALSFLPFHSVFQYAGFFILGLLLFLIREQIMEKKTGLTLTVISAILCFLTRGPEETIAGILTVVAITALDFSNPLLDYLGKISYSLYLVHFPIFLISERYLSSVFPVPASNSGKLIVLLMYVGIAIGFATLFYYVVERNFLRWAKRIRIGKKIPEEKRMSAG